MSLLGKQQANLYSISCWLN